MEKYKAQLEQVTSSLNANPENKQLLSLKNKLEQILALKSETENKNASVPRIQQHTSDFPLQVGEVCEIFDETEKYWKLGNIVSMTLERDFYIITLSKSDNTHRIAAVHVRRPIHREKKVNTKSKAVQKPQAFRPLRKSKPEPEGPNKWKAFSEKMIKK